MKCLIIDAVHESITEELGKYMQVDNLYTAEMDGKADAEESASEQAAEHTEG